MLQAADVLSPRPSCNTLSRASWGRLWASVEAIRGLGTFAAAPSVSPTALLLRAETVSPGNPAPPHSIWSQWHCLKSLCGPRSRHKSAASTLHALKQTL